MGSTAPRGSSSRHPRVVALVSTYNEVDVIECVLEDLVRNGIEFYLLDHGSTDGTRESIERFHGRGLLGFELLDGSHKSRVSWSTVLRRKEELSASIDADWFLHHDADEFRESPWPGMGLVEAIAQVDGLSFNAIDFELLNFQPTHDDFQPGDDPRESFPCFERALPFDRAQVRCWKRTSRVDLLSSGGHEARFLSRRVFPLRFLLRHYPIRSQAHGERKVFLERRGRFERSDADRGWHRQYDRVALGHRFVRDPAALERFDADRVRRQLLTNHREHEEARDPDLAAARLRAQSRWEIGELNARLDAAQREARRLEMGLDQGNRKARLLAPELDARNRENAELHEGLDARNRENAELHEGLDARNRENAELHEGLDARNWENAELHEGLDTSNREAAGLHENLDLRNRECDALHAELDTRNRELLTAEQRLDSSQCERVDLRERVIDGEERVVELSGLLSAHAEEVETLRKKLEAHGRALETLEASREHVSEELRSVLASRSWRWSRPLRALTNWLGVS